MRFVTADAESAAAARRPAVTTDSSRRHDAGAVSSTLPALLDALEAAARPASAAGRTHLVLAMTARQRPPRAEVAARADGRPLPAAWRRALVAGWPPAVSGLHRIELVPGRVWVSIVPPAVDAPARRCLRALQAPPRARPTSRHAVVIGAGLAGCAMADALLRRDWTVTVLESQPRTGGAVHGVPWLALHPALSPGPDRRSRLLVRAMLIADRLRMRLGDALLPTGRFDPMPLAEALRRAEGLPPELVEPIACASRDRHGVHGTPGLWMPIAGVVDPRAWWDRLAADAGLELRLATAVAALRDERATGRWQAEDVAGRPLAASPVVVLANQRQAFPLAAMGPPAHAPLRLRPGRVRIADAVDPGSVGHRPVLGTRPFRIEVPGRGCVVGDEAADDLDAEPPRPAAASANEPCENAWHRWRWSPAGERLLLRDNLPMIGAVPDEAAVLADAARLARNDRLPMPRRAGLFVLTGLGGRGALWSLLGAEMIAAEIDGEPVMVEPDLADAVDPARFLRRALRRSRSAAGPVGRRAASPDPVRPTE